jgi:single-stranded-DNA-specific exonuclease
MRSISSTKQHPGLILRFGGHAAAAGLSIRAEDFETFRQRFDTPAASVC